MICTTHNLLKLFTFAMRRLPCNKCPAAMSIWTGS
jgi:hypothetical protein